MKRPIHKMPRESVVLEYPIEGVVPGWFFRVREESPGCFHAEGMDLFGRKISREGTDPEDVLKSCTDGALSIIEQLSQQLEESDSGSP